MSISRKLVFGAVVGVCLGFAVVALIGWLDAHYPIGTMATQAMWR